MAFDAGNTKSRRTLPSEDIPPSAGRANARVVVTAQDAVYIASLLLGLATFVFLATQGFETYYDDGPTIDHGYVQCGAPIAEIFRDDYLVPNPCGAPGMARVLGGVLAAAVVSAGALLVGGALFSADVDWLKKWLKDKGVIS